MSPPQPNNTSSCFYCELEEDGDSTEHFIRLVTSDSVVLFLHRDQTLPGRVVLASRPHFGDVTEFTDQVQTDFYGMVHVCGNVIKQIHPEILKVNLALCGNNPLFEHPHIHLMPRHEKDREWPGFFLNFVQPYWGEEDPRWDQEIRAFHEQLKPHQDRFKLVWSERTKQAVS